MFTSSLVGVVLGVVLNVISLFGESSALSKLLKLTGGISKVSHLVGDREASPPDPGISNVPGQESART